VRERAAAQQLATHHAEQEKKTQSQGHDAPEPRSTTRNN
jgi:hypothetical protein